MRNFFRHSGRVSDRRRKVRLHLEALEDRTLLSNYVVDLPGDAGQVDSKDATGLSGDIRYCITQANANAGSTITFNTQAVGSNTITLTHGELDIESNMTIDGPGACLLAVSGDDATRVFAIDVGVTAEIDGLTITHGLAAVNGGGILNNGGILTLSHDVISDNEAQGASGASGKAASGGGIANVNGATLNIRFSTLSNNKAIGGNATGTGNGGIGEGGGLYNGPGSTMIVSADLITDNHAVGGDATGTTGTGGRGLGGGIDNVGESTKAASLTVSDSTFTDNQAVGGDGGGFVFGGAIRNGYSDLSVTGSIFTNNLAQGGKDGTGGLQPGAVYGGALSCTFIVNLTTGENVTTGDVDRSIFRNNQAVGGNDNTGGSFLLPGTIDTTNTITVPGAAAGGAILVGAGNLKVSDSVFTGNQAIGGDRNTGGTAKYSFVGSGYGGAVFVLLNVGTNPGSATIYHSTFTNNQAKGGTGNLPGTGETSYLGDATAGAIGTDFGGTLEVSNSTLANNQAIGGTGADGHKGGDGVGGGIGDQFDHLLFKGGSLTMSNDTLAHNQAIGGAGGNGGGAGGNGKGGGAYNDSDNATISGSRIVGNDAIGAAGGEGMGGGFYNASSDPAKLIDNIIEGNDASTSYPNIYPEETPPPEAMLIDALMSLLGNKTEQGS